MSDCPHDVIRFGGKAGSGVVDLDGKYHYEYVCDRCNQRWLAQMSGCVLRRDVLQQQPQAALDL